MSLFLRGVHVLIALGFVVLLYLVVIWVLPMLGLSVPADILKVCFVLLGLIAVAGALSGKFDNWWA